MQNLIDQFRANARSLTPNDFWPYVSEASLIYLYDPAPSEKQPIIREAYNQKDAEILAKQNYSPFWSLNKFVGKQRRVEKFNSTMALGVDIDVVTTAEYNVIPIEQIDKRKSDVLEKLQRFPCQCHEAHETRKGLHIVFFVTGEQGQEGLKLFREAENILVDYFGADPGASLITQLLRFPGSLHLKEPQSPFVCRSLIDHLDEVPAYNLRDFIEILQTKIKPFLVPKTQNVEVDIKTAKTPLAIAGSRNIFLTSIAGTLRHRGLSETTIIKALQGINGIECNPPLSDNEVAAIGKSIGKYPAPSQLAVGQKIQNTPVLIRLSDVVPEAIQWLWTYKIPRGKITMMEGDPGNGKSWCSLAIASAVSRGYPLPGDTLKLAPANVLLLTAEDGAADTIYPRLDGMGADLARIKI